MNKIKYFNWIKLSMILNYILIDKILDEMTFYRWKDKIKLVHTELDKFKHIYNYEECYHGDSHRIEETHYHIINAEIQIKYTRLVELDFPNIFLLHNILLIER